MLTGVKNGVNVWWFKMFAASLCQETNKHTKFSAMSQEKIHEAKQALYAVCDCQDAIQHIWNLQDRIDIDTNEELWNKISDIKHDMYAVLEELKAH